jgi:hypothetical protein
MSQRISKKDQRTKFKAKHGEAIPQILPQNCSDEKTLLLPYRSYHYHYNLHCWCFGPQI